MRLNLGAGHQQAQGWIAYDRSRAPLLIRFSGPRAGIRLAKRIGLAPGSAILEWPAGTRSRDLTRGIPHPGDSVDSIYTSHMLEHLPAIRAES